MYLDFKNKIVIITGGTRGIGAAIAKNFNDSGAHVLVSGTDKAEENKLENFSSNNSIQYHQLDLKWFLLRKAMIKDLEIYLEMIPLSQISLLILHC